MNVRFLDLAATHAEIQSAVESAISDVVSSNVFVLGEQCEGFEREFAAYVQAKHCIGVGNGLDALTLALLACGIEPGDEVLVPTNTFIATWLSVIHAGGVPVGVEPDPATYNMDPVDAARRISPRTRFIVPVHLYGQPADLDSLRALATETGCVVIEDAAQAHGARLGGRRIGSGTAVAWSFYPGKNLGAMGDAGAVTTDDAEISQRLRLLRNYGSQHKYVHDVLGVNSRLDEIQASVLRVKLKHLDAWNARRNQISNWYRLALDDTPLILPAVPAGAEPVWHLFVVRSPHRDALRAHLAHRGIETLIHYPIPPHRQKGLSQYASSCFPVADTVAESVVSLPMGPHLVEAEIATVGDAVRDFVP
jgi:dTDP-4-amino-4,6-dideoxygalactose transaminase